MSSPLFLDPLVVALIDGPSVLDVACGSGKWGYLIRSCWWWTSSPGQRKGPAVLVGIDIFLGYLKLVKYHRIYDHVVRCHVSRLPFRGKSFDVVIASEIIEHLDKQDGDLLLSELDRVYRKTIILTTPNWVRKRGGLETTEGFNPYEKHVSRWGIRRLRSRGYVVRGIGLLPLGFTVLLNSIFAPVTYLFPVLSTHLVATKHRRGQF